MPWFLLLSFPAILSAAVIKRIHKTPLRWTATQQLKCYQRWTFCIPAAARWVLLCFMKVYIIKGADTAQSTLVLFCTGLVFGVLNILTLTWKQLHCPVCTVRCFGHGTDTVSSFNMRTCHLFVCLTMWKQLKANKKMFIHAQQDNCLKLNRFNLAVSILVFCHPK